MDYLVKSVKWTEHNKVDMWWGSNRSGYTDLICEAGIYSEEEAKKLESEYGENNAKAIEFDEHMVGVGIYQLDLYAERRKEQIEMYKRGIRNEEKHIAKTIENVNKLKERLSK